MIILTHLQSLMVIFICLASSSICMDFWHLDIKLILSPPGFSTSVRGTFSSYTSSKTAASFLSLDTSISSCQLFSCFTFQLTHFLLLQGEYSYSYKVNIIIFLSQAQVWRWSVFPSVVYLANDCDTGFKFRSVFSTGLGFFLSSNCFWTIRITQIMCN